MNLGCIEYGQDHIAHIPVCVGYIVYSSGFSHYPVSVEAMYFLIIKSHIFLEGFCNLIAVITIESEKVFIWHRWLLVRDKVGVFVNVADILSR